jgi:hypothetical protein
VNSSLYVGLTLSAIVLLAKIGESATSNQQSLSRLPLPSCASSEQ